jgi:hypothetical protein
MPLPLFRRTPDDTICALYGVIVAQARRPACYLAYAVADAVIGRFELGCCNAYGGEERAGGSHGAM